MTRKKAKTKPIEKAPKELKLTQVQLWKWRALQAETETALAQKHHEEYRLQKLLESIPEVQSLLALVQKKKTLYASRRGAYNTFMTDLSELLDVDLNRCEIDTDTGRVITAQEE